MHAAGGGAAAAFQRERGVCLDDAFRAEEQAIRSGGMPTSDLSHVAETGTGREIFRMTPATGG
jgi:hypothetical protein